MSLAAAPRARQGARPTTALGPSHPRGLSLVLASEVVSSLVGFVTLSTTAWRLGPSAFSDVEYATVVASWLLVLVRGGADVVVARECARKPRLLVRLTELLLGLRLVAAAFGMCLMLALAVLLESPRGPLVALGSLVLLMAAGAADVFPRATGQLGWLALPSLVRAITQFLGTAILVRGPGDARTALGCLIAGEFLATVAASWPHWRRHGSAWPRWFGRASRMFLARGLLAGWVRLARVTLFGLDILAMGWLGGTDPGAYAAARRIVFALAGFGILVPGLLGPALSRDWNADRGWASERLGRVSRGLWSISLPASLGLMITADRTMPFLFGPEFDGGGAWLIVVAARLPWLLSAVLAQTALMACRREAACGRLMGWQFLFAGVAMTIGVSTAGPLGAGLAALAVEFLGALGGWVMLGRLGVPFRLALPDSRCLVASAVMVVACRLTPPLALPGVWCLGAVSYALAWWAAGRLGSR